MNALLILLATATMGIDVGGQRLDDGGYEYIIQIEPQLLNNLLKGKDLVSEVPPGMDVRKYRITVGTGELPQDFGVTAAEEKSSEAEKATADPAETAADETEAEASETEVAKKATSGDEDGVVQEETAFRGPADSSKRQPRLLANESTKAQTFDSDPADGPLLKKPLIDRSGVRTAASTARDTYDDVDDEPGKSGSKKSGSRANDRTTGTKSRYSSDASEERPWNILVFTVICLFASLGANLYLGWTAWAARMRYADLLDQYQVDRGQVDRHSVGV